MRTSDLRQTFIDFFSSRDHVVRPGASLIPTDPTLLLVNAGMVPFKPFFLGEEVLGFDRAVSVQRCVRTVDIDIIGKTNRHLSFFEMLGNFSFGDYFKEQAIVWAYELATEVLGLDEGRLWYTVYDTDEEAKAIWIDRVGVPPERVQYGGKDNFWQMGVPGPCGPSSEIFWDMGSEYGDDGGPVGGGEERFVELWNLVFMQNIQDEPYHVVGDLPAKNIDTGMGLERMAAVLQGVSNVFDIDTLGSIRDRAAAYTGLTYGDDPDDDISLRILADHARSVVFMISDGVVPSNDGRGYILRRLLRRAVLHGWKHGGKGLVFPGLVEATVEAMSDGYPELLERQDQIKDTVIWEEERFRTTLESGSVLLEAELAKPDLEEISGITVFKLHDTFGFPVDLTKEMAQERGVGIDMAGFEAAMEDQRSRARLAWKGGDSILSEQIYRELIDASGPTEFVGYETETADATILAILRDGEFIDRAEEGQAVDVFLDRTPFYGESGGQVGDTGRFTAQSGIAEVLDTQHALQGLHGHRATISRGVLSVGQPVVASIDSPRREAIRKAHTGTHVLHWSLRHVLGDHASQAGSHVSDGRVRFDFSHFSQVADQEIAEIEAEANRRLIGNAPVMTAVTTKERAQEMGALAFFGDKYGDTVRVVKVGDFSTEFCGGTHTHTAGQVGPLLIMSESSIGSNLRRVEALTGLSAYQHLVRTRKQLHDAGRLLRANPDGIVDRLEGLLDKVSELEKRLVEFEGQNRGELAGDLAASAQSISGSMLVVASIDDADASALREVALAVRSRHPGPSVTVLGSVVGGKGALVGAVSPDLVAKGVSAADLVAEGARLLGGGGSRDPELAQAGGPEGSQLGNAVDVIRQAAEVALQAL